MSLDRLPKHLVWIPPEMAKDPDVPMAMTRMLEARGVAVLLPRPSSMRGLPASLRDVAGSIMSAAWADDDHVECHVRWGAMRLGHLARELLDTGTYVLVWDGRYVQTVHESERASVQRATVPGMAEQVHGEG